MLSHGLRPPQIKGNLILVKNGLHLELVGLHITQKQPDILVASAIMEPLTNGLGHIFQFFFLIANRPNL